MTRVKSAKSKVKSRPLIRAAQIVSRRDQDGSWIVIRLDAVDRFFRIDGLAGEAWNLINDRRSRDDIKNLLLKKFKLPEKRFERDYSNLLKKLEKLKLISK